MAEPVFGVTSAVLTTVTLALEAATKLYQITNSFKSNAKAVIDFRDKFCYLDQLLQKNLTDSSKVNLAALDRPLAGCSDACAELNALIKTETVHLHMLPHMGEDIAIENTKQKLKNQSQAIRTGLESLVRSQTAAEIDTAEFRRMREEKDSVQKCLAICEGLLAIITQSQSTLPVNSNNTHKCLDKGQVAGFLDLVASSIQIIKEIHRSDASSIFEIGFNGDKFAMKLVSKCLSM